MDMETLIGLIMMIVIGPAVGNYATSVVYRLPLGQTPFEKHPYCGNCDTMLKPIDLFPIWSYVFLRGKCRYCGVNIPPIHTIVEVTCGILFIVNFLVFGISETFILLTSLGVFLITLAALDSTQGRLYPIILTACFALAAIYRVMLDGSIFPMIQSGFILFFVSIAIWQIGLIIRKGLKRNHTPEETGYTVPDAAMMAALIGVMLPLEHAPIAIGTAFAAYALQRAFTALKIVSVAGSLGLWVGVLFAV